MAKRMTTHELEAVLNRLQNNATGAFNGSISHHRAQLLDRYFGEKYGDEDADRSSVVDTTVRDVIESIKPELMDIFFGGDKVVEFAPQGPEDEEAAEQETEVVNYVVMQKNDGFKVFYDWFTDALLMKTGYVKRYWDERDTSEIEEYDELTPDELAKVMTDATAEGEVDVISQWENTTPQVEVLDPMAAMQFQGIEPGMRVEGLGEVTEVDMQDDGSMRIEYAAIDTVGIKIRVSKTVKEYKLEAVPPEEVYVSPEWSRLDFNGCPFHAHRRAVPVSDLIEMGFDRKQVEELQDYDARNDNEEAENRFTAERYSETDLGSRSDTSMRRVLVYENYVRVDRNGDGIAELLRIWSGGEQGHILKKGGKPAIDEVYASPINVLCPLPVPHKHYGLSVSELVDDLARIMTVLTRQLVDNIVLNNYPDQIVDSNAADEETYKALAVTRPGRTIAVPGGMASLGFQTPPSTAGETLQGLEYIKALREERTGVTRYNQGLDADSLNKTASGVNQIISQANKKILLIARIFAETGVKQLFADIHRDLRRGPLKSIAMRLNNDWVEVDPRMWKDRADLTISVGLGTGDRGKQAAALEYIYAAQKEGMAQGITDYSHLHTSLVKMVELAGFKNPDKFFPTPQEVQAKQQQAAQQEQQPDPNMVLAQAEMAKAQSMAQKAQFDAQAEQARHQVELAKLEFEKVRLAFEQAKLDQAKAKEDTARLKVLMEDDRARDLEGAKIEAAEAARMQKAVDGMGLTNGQ